MYVAGIDAGSRAIKIVVLNQETNEVVARAMGDQKVKQKLSASELFYKTIEEKEIKSEEIVRTIATGYGRNLIDIAKSTITEITCHARGVYHTWPKARTIIEIGGQDSKLIQLDLSGAVRDFSMNDRCAAGTGRFLEVVADRLELDLNDIGRVAQTSEKPCAISSMCVVFAETEIIGLLASGAAPEDIVAGVCESIAKRIASQAGRNLKGPIVFTGGVALIPGMEMALASAFRQPISIVPNPQFTGALGAALLAGESRF